MFYMMHKYYYSILLCVCVCVLGVCVYYSLVQSVDTVCMYVHCMYVYCMYVYYSTVLTVYDCNASEFLNDCVF